MRTTLIFHQWRCLNRLKKGAKRPIGISKMPQIYLTQEEMDALAFFQSIANAAYEAVSDEALQSEYNKHCTAFYSVHDKYLTARKKAADKALVKRVLKDIRANK